MPSSECLERCLSYCLLFPPGHEFHSDSMVLLWIAEGVIDGEASERLEDRGFICLQILLCHGFIMLSGSLADEFLIIDRDGFSKFARKPLHVSLPGERFDSQTLEALLMCKELRTLLLLGDFRYLVKQVPRGLFLSLNLLRTLDLSQTKVSEFPSSVGNLEDLRYLDLSGTLIRELPGVIYDLVNLQTLKLRDCSEFSALPKGTAKLTKLRLDLDIITAYITKLVLRWNECINAEVERTILESLLPHPNLSELHIQFYSGSVLPSWIGDSSFTNLTNITLYMCINCSSFTTIGRLPSLKFNIFGMDKVKNLDCLSCTDNQGSGTQQFSPSSYKRTLQSMSHDEIDFLSYDDFQGNDRHPFFPLLEKLTVENMSRLQEWTEIELDNCSELECFPDIPASLGTLIIQDCPKLQEQCRKGEGRDWQKIARVHYIWIQHRQIYPVSGSQCS
ncbi:hypothetical protein LIER_43154 [Lithospermum erythrorhizon]|uniref:Disease resistance RPP13-like protein 1 n=1 Tax=Lithospermum erythrorhizon TaxID=34254 RepID=A0AAV3PJC9_LITER